jgi:4-hydroxybenzoate polyprenyltransferase
VPVSPVEGGVRSSVATDIVPDSERRGLIGALPAAARPYASLIRLDRPIGVGCSSGRALGDRAGRDGRGIAAGLGWSLIAWFALGAFAMRSAGCVYNDIVDRDLDGKSSARDCGRSPAGACRCAAPGCCWWG